MKGQFIATTKSGATCKILKEENDPLCLRVSMGGTARDGYYFVFRGDVDEIEKMFDEVHDAFRNAAAKYKERNN